MCIRYTGEISVLLYHLFLQYPSKAKSIRLQLYQIMISFIPLGKASQITKRPASTNFSTHVDYKVFSFFESVEGLIFSCFVKARCKALDLFSYIVVTHNNVFLSTEQTWGDTLLFCISLKRLLCYTRPWKKEDKKTTNNKNRAVAGINWSRWQYSSTRGNTKWLSWWILHGLYKIQ